MSTKKWINKIKSFGIEILLRNARIFDIYEKYKSKKRVIEEDIFLRKEIIKFKEPIKIIQIGANDGLRSDPVRRLIIDYKCEAIFVEADPVCFNSLKKNYSYLQEGNLKFLNSAIVPNKSEKLVFYSLSEKFRKTIKISKQIKYARKSSTNKDILIDYFTKIGIKDAKNAISEQSVESTIINELIDTNFVPNILVIDTEGLDWSLLDSLNLSKFSPEVILFESSFKPNKDLEDSVMNKLTQFGYEIIKFKYNIGCILNR